MYNRFGVGLNKKPKYIIERLTAKDRTLKRNLFLENLYKCSVINARLAFKVNVIYSVKDDII